MSANPTSGPRCRRVSSWAITSGLPALLRKVGGYLQKSAPCMHETVTDDDFNFSSGYGSLREAKSHIWTGRSSSATHCFNTLAKVAIPF